MTKWLLAAVVILGTFTFWDHKCEKAQDRIEKIRSEIHTINFNYEVTCDDYEVEDIGEFATNHLVRILHRLRGQDSRGIANYYKDLEWRVRDVYEYPIVYCFSQVRHTNQFALTQFTLEKDKYPEVYLIVPSFMDVWHAIKDSGDEAYYETFNRFAIKALVKQLEMVVVPQTTVAK